MSLLSAPEGMPYARRVVADYLREHLPAYLVDLRLAWGIDEVALPDPDAVLGRPAQVVGEWPLIAVASTADVLNGRVDHGVDSIEYDSTYTLRIFSWVNAEYDDVWDMRDRYAAAIRVALLDSPTLRGKPVVVQEAGLSTSAGEPELANGDRWLAGSFITVRLLVHEALVRRPSATVGSVTVGANRLSAVPLRPPSSPTTGRPVVTSGLLSAPLASHPALD